MFRRILPGTCVTLIVFGVSCGDSVVAPPTPAAITAVSPASIDGSVGAPVSVTVRVTNGQGGALANASVSFAAGAGNGSVSPATVSTDARGEASSTWTLGTAAGTQSLSASVSSSLRVTFTAAATPGEARSVAVQGQAPPSGMVGSDAAPPPVFVVRDAHGNPVPGVTVSFTLRAGNGSFEPDSTVTDGQGQVAVERWTLGTTAGVNTLAAHVAGVPMGTVTVNGTAAAPATMVSLAGQDQDGEVGAPVATPPAVQVRDGYGNPVQGVTIAFAVVEGGGAVSSAVHATNAAGVAAVAWWTLGSVVGVNTLAATLPGIEPVVFTARAGASTFNLYIESVHLNQGSQTRAGSIGAVAGRPGLLRVIVRGSTQLNQHAPTVRVRLYDGAVMVREALIPAPRLGVPLNPDLADASQTWNLQLSAEDVVAGLTVEAVADPDGAIAETDRDDNRFPRGTGTASLDVLPLAPMRVVFIPVHTTAQNRTGNISSANMDAFLVETRTWTPGNVVLPTIRSTYTTGLDLSVGDNWSRLVGEIQAIRIAAGATDEYYHGIVAAFPGTPWGGWAYIPDSPASRSRSGITYDAFPSASRLLAHELGHNLGRRHAPCGNAAGIDHSYPHVGATLGSPGYDIITGEIIEPETHHDYMGYCGPWWASDYTYDGILQWRRSDPYARPEGGAPAANTADDATDGLLLWGRVQSGGATLNPAFSLRARPALPETAGPHELRGLAADGSVVFRLSFAGVQVDHSEDPAERHFAFFVPLRPDEQERIERIELVTPRGSATRRPDATMQARAAPAPSDVRLESRPGNRVAVVWDATRHPMVMVRDPQTGNVLSIGRGGTVELPGPIPAGDRLEVLLSDGVRSRAWE
ncbi:MAG TPA: hypothetical protein VK929_10660 [Longimicrobiales bacterium]|nr:hypothetical protein [Longimicrobiales bacterium]